MKPSLKYLLSGIVLLFLALILDTLHPEELTQNLIIWAIGVIFMLVALLLEQKE